ncbi:MAG: hypothetical protein R3C12_07005 [Planctomycetaceae bacterium]
MKNSLVIDRKLRVIYTAIGLLVLFLLANSAYLWSITSLEYWTGAILQSWFYYVMFLLHLAAGVTFAVAMAVFIAWHFRLSRAYPNVAARRIGIALSLLVAVLTLTGFLLVRLVGIAELNHPGARRVIYWLHVLTPLVAVWLYWLHRVAGRRIDWQAATRFWGKVLLLSAVFGGLHWYGQPARSRGVGGTTTGVSYITDTGPYAPSFARSATGQHIAPEVLMDDKFCLECHQDVHARWASSASLQFVQQSRLPGLHLRSSATYYWHAMGTRPPSTECRLSRSRAAVLGTITESRLRHGARRNGPGGDYLYRLPCHRRNQFHLREWRLHPVCARALSVHA